MNLNLSVDGVMKEFTKTVDKLIRISEREQANVERLNGELEKSKSERDRASMLIEHFNKFLGV